MAGERILIADDEPEVVDLCTRLLVNQDYVVQAAISGQEAIAYLEAEPFDLLVIDIRMPDMDGLAVLRRGRELNPDLAAVVITGFATVDRAREAMRSGARGFVLKPFDVQEFIHVATEALEERRRERERLRLRAQLPILEIARALVAESDLDRIAGRLLETVGRELATDQALLTLLDGPTDELSVAGAIGLSAEGRDALRALRIPAGQGAAGRAVWGDKPVLLDGTADLESPLQTLLGQPDARIMLVPLRTGQESVGVLILSRPASGRPFAAGDLNLMSIVSTQIATALENARLFRETERLKTFNESIVQSVAEAIVIEDARGTITFVNPAAEALLSYDRYELIGQPWTFITPESEIEKLCGRAADGEGRYETALLSKGGRAIPVIASTRPLFEGDKFVGSLVAFTDITERKRAEEGAKHRAETLTAINELAIQCAAAPPDSDLFELITQKLQSITGALAISLSTYDPQAGALVIQHLAVSGPIPSHLNELIGRNVIGMHIPVSPDLLRRMLTEVVAVSEDLSEMTFSGIPKPVATAIQEAFGIGSFTGLALRYGDELVGTIMIVMLQGQPSLPLDVAKTFAHVAVVSLRRKKAEDALRESEERFRNIFEHSPIGIYQTTPGGRILTGNPALVHMLGYASFEELAQRDLERQEYFPGYSRADFKRRVEGDGRIIGLETAWAKKDGSKLWVRENARAIRDDWDNVYYEGTVEDITERKQAEEALQKAKDELAKQNIRLQALYRVGQMVNSTLETDAILAHLTDEAMRVTRATHGQVLVVREDIGGFEWHALRGFPPEEAAQARTIVQRLDQGLNGRAYRTRQAVCLDDVQTATDYLPFVPTTRAELVIPIMRGGQVLGNLDLQSPEVGAFRDVDLDYLNALADQSAIALENARAFRAVEEAERDWETTFNAMQDAIVMVDQDQRIVHANQVFVNMTRRTWPKLAGRLYSSVLGKPKCLRKDCPLEQTMESGQPATCVHQMGGRIFDVQTVPIAGRDVGWLGPAVRVLYVMRDVTQREEMQQALQRRVAQLTGLSQASQVVTTSLELDQVLAQIVSLAGEVLGADYTSVLLVDEAGHVRQSVENLPGTLAIRDHIRAEGVTRWVMSSHQPVLIDEIIGEEGAINLEALGAGAPRFANPLLVKVGVRSYVGLPLMVKDRLLGVLYLYSLRPGTFSDQLPLLVAFANQVAAGIDNARLYDELRQRVAELAALNIIVGAVTSSLDLQETLTVVTDYATQLLNVAAASIALKADGGLRFAAASGEGSDLVLGGRLAMGQGIAGWVVEHGQPLLVPDVSQDPRFFGEFDRESQFTTRSILCVPLQTKGQTIGAIEVINKADDRFGPRDLPLLTSLAASAATAIENARLFKEVRAARDRLQTLSRRLVEVQEAERRHIARELHDEVGQVLTGLKLTLEMSASLPPEAFKANLDEAQTLVNELMAEVRNLSLDLRPAMLDDLGLLPTLLWHFERYTAQTQVHVAFKQVGLERRFQPEAETVVYRIIQEALTNVARHAGVGNVTVRVWADEETLNVQVEDQGGGFDPEAALAAGASGGLSGMYERVGLLGGQLHIESVAGAGTRLIARLPLSGLGKKKEG